MTALTRKILAALLSALFFCSQTVFASAAEANLWAERKRQIKLASLPAAQTPFHPAHVFNSLSSERTALQPQVNQENFLERAHPALSPALKNLTQALPANKINIQEVFSPQNSDEPPLLLLQDVHLNDEAQMGISDILFSLIDQNQVGLIGVEGAFSPFDFSPYRQFQNNEIAGQVAESFLTKNLLAAPSYVGIAGNQEPPLTVGVDDRDLYQKNLDALFDGRAEKAGILQEFKKQEANLRDEKERIFSKSLLEFEKKWIGFHSQTFGLGEYVQAIKRFPITLPKTLAQFMEAQALEEKLNFDRVDRERKTALTRLAQTLDAAEKDRLMARAVAYRSGALAFGQFYGELENLFEEKKVNLKETPSFQSYIRYVLLAEGIQARALFEDLEKAEKAIFETLIQTDEERNLIQQSQQLVLSKKLVDFELTPYEWEKYQELRTWSLEPRKEAPFQAPGSRLQDLKTFERFYQMADLRSSAMLNKLESVRSSQKPTVLILGGFHAPLIAEQLKEKNISYLIAAPKLTKIEGLNGSEYLSIFSRDKTPLETLFAGEKLFVYPSHLSVGTRQSETRQTEALLEAVLKVETMAHGQGLASTQNEVVRIGDKTFELNHQENKDGAFLHTVAIESAALTETVLLSGLIQALKQGLLAVGVVDGVALSGFLIVSVSGLFSLLHPDLWRPSTYPGGKLTLDEWGARFTQRWVGGPLLTGPLLFLSGPLGIILSGSLHWVWNTVYLYRNQILNSVIGQNPLVRNALSNLIPLSIFNPDPDLSDEEIKEAAFQFLVKLTKKDPETMEPFKILFKNLERKNLVFIIPNLILDSIIKKFRRFYVPEKGKIEGLNIRGLAFVGEEAYFKAIEGDKDGLLAFRHEALHSQYYLQNGLVEEISEKHIVSELHSFFVSFLEVYGPQEWETPTKKTGHPQWKMDLATIIGDYIPPGDAYDNLRIKAFLAGQTIDALVTDGMADVAIALLGRSTTLNEIFAVISREDLEAIIKDYQPDADPDSIIQPDHEKISKEFHRFLENFLAEKFFDGNLLVRNGVSTEIRENFMAGNEYLALMQGSDETVDEFSLRKLAYRVLSNRMGLSLSKFEKDDETGFYKAKFNEPHNRHSEAEFIGNMRPEWFPSQTHLGLATISHQSHFETNEDSAFSNELKNGIIISGVFDGVGGEPNGKEASYAVAKIFAEAFSGLETFQDPERVSEEQIIAWVTDFIKTSFYPKFFKLMEGKKGGTTGVLAIVLPRPEGKKKAIILNGGDSRASLFQNGFLAPLTLDNAKPPYGQPNLVLNSEEVAVRYFEGPQKLLSEFTDKKSLTDGDRKIVERRQFIENAFNFDERYRPVFTVVDMEAGGRLVLTSDGIDDNLTRAEKEEIIGRDILAPSGQINMNHIAENLVRASMARSIEFDNDRAKKDDMTALVIENPLKEVDGRRLWKNINGLYMESGSIARGISFDEETRILINVNSHAELALSQAAEGIRVEDALSGKILKTLKPGEHFDLGRHPLNDLFILGGVVSRFAATLFVDSAGRLMVRDNFSKNGISITVQNPTAYWVLESAIREFERRSFSEEGSVSQLREDPENRLLSELFTKESVNERSKIFIDRPTPKPGGIIERLLELGEKIRKSKNLYDENAPPESEAKRTAFLLSYLPIMEKKITDALFKNGPDATNPSLSDSPEWIQASLKFVENLVENLLSSLAQEEESFGRVPTHIRITETLSSSASIVKKKTYEEIRITPHVPNPPAIVISQTPQGQLLTLSIQRKNAIGEFQALNLFGADKRPIPGQASLNKLSLSGSEEISLDYDEDFRVLFITLWRKDGDSRRYQVTLDPELERLNMTIRTKTAFNEYMDHWTLNSFKAEKEKPKMILAFNMGWFYSGVFFILARNAERRSLKKGEPQSVKGYLDSNGRIVVLGDFIDVNLELANRIRSGEEKEIQIFVNWDDPALPYVLIDGENLNEKQSQALFELEQTINAPIQRWREILKGQFSAGKYENDLGPDSLTYELASQVTGIRGIQLIREARAFGISPEMDVIVDANGNTLGIYKPDEAPESLNEKIIKGEAFKLYVLIDNKPEEPLRLSHFAPRSTPEIRSLFSAAIQLINDASNAREKNFQIETEREVSGSQNKQREEGAGSQEIFLSFHQFPDERDHIRKWIEDHFDQFDSRHEFSKQDRAQVIPFLSTLFFERTKIHESVLRPGTVDVTTDKGSGDMRFLEPLESRLRDVLAKPSLNQTRVILGLYEGWAKSQKLSEDRKGLKEAIARFEREITNPFGIRLINGEKSSPEKILLTINALKLIPEKLLKSDYLKNYLTGIDLEADRDQGARLGHYIQKEKILGIQRTFFTKRQFIETLLHEVGHAFEASHKSNLAFLKALEASLGAQGFSAIYKIPALGMNGQARHEEIFPRSANPDEALSEFFGETFMQFILRGPLFEQGFPGFSVEGTNWKILFDYYRDEVFSGKSYLTVDAARPDKESFPPKKLNSISVNAFQFKWANLPAQVFFGVFLASLPHELLHAVLLKWLGIPIDWIQSSVFSGIKIKEGRAPPIDKIQDQAGKLLLARIAGPFANVALLTLGLSLLPLAFESASLLRFYFYGALAANGTLLLLDTLVLPLVSPRLRSQSDAWQALQDFRVWKDGPEVSLAKVYAQTLKDTEGLSLTAETLEFVLGPSQNLRLTDLNHRGIALSDFSEDSLATFTRALGKELSRGREKTSLSSEDREKAFNRAAALFLAMEGIRNDARSLPNKNVAIVLADVQDGTIAKVRAALNRLSKDQNLTLILKKGMSQDLTSALLAGGLTLERFTLIEEEEAGMFINQRNVLQPMALRSFLNNNLVPKGSEGTWVLLTDSSISHSDDASDIQLIRTFGFSWGQLDQWIQFIPPVTSVGLSNILEAARAASLSA